MLTPRQRRRAGFTALAGILVWAFAEGAGLLGWWITTGAPFTWSAAAAQREAVPAAATGANTAAAGSVAPTHGNALAGERCVLHPFLGYVYDHSAAQLTEQVSSFGLVDDASPLQQRGPDRFIVGVTGGSLALLLCDSAEAALVAALSRSPRLQGKRIEVVRLGIGGWKQPQLLFAMQLATVLGGQFDCLVNLDGFNEVALVGENVPVGVPAWFPRSWARLMDHQPTAAQQLRLGKIALLGEQRAELAANAAAARWSPLYQFVWLVRERRLAASMQAERASAERAAIAPSFAITGPGPSSSSLADARQEMAAVWQRSSLALQALCASVGTSYFHFLQPNQYVAGSKPIGDEEQQVAILPGSIWQEGVVQGYPLLQQEAVALRQAGVRYEDLTTIFREHPEPLYFDNCCHLNKDGYEILAEHIAAAIRRYLDLDGVTFTRIASTPERLELRSPLAGERVVVEGIDTSGGRVDITGGGFGTTARSEPADLVTVTADGRVRALRRGDGELVVEHGGFQVRLPVSADWPEVLEIADGKVGPDGSLPRVELVSPSPAGTLRIRCGGLPAQGARLLVAADQPVPATVPKKVGLTGFTLVTLPPDAAPAPVDMPRQPAGHPTFVRCLVFSPDLTTVVAASPLLVVTPR